MLGEASPTLDRSQDEGRRPAEGGLRTLAAAALDALRAALERSVAAAPSDLDRAPLAVTVALGGALGAIRPADAWRALVEALEGEGEREREGEGEGEAFCWAEPVGARGAEDDGAAWSFVGAGVAARIEAAGPERVAAVRAEAEPLLARLRDVREEGTAAAPRPAFFGGIAFAPAPAPAPDGGAPSMDGDLWRGFADASFVLPRWLLAMGVEGTFLRLTTERTPRPEELPALLQEARAVLAALAGAVEAPSVAAGAQASRAQVTPQPEAAWHGIVGDAVARIGRGEMTKVVASTRTRLAAARAFDVHSALRRLDQAQPQCLRFAVRRGAGADAAVFLGATPERLVDKRGPRARLDALAGTVRRDRADAQRALLQSDKDRREHAVVVDFLRQALSPFGRVRAAEEPSVRALRDLLHLWTPVEVSLTGQTHVLDLVARLHPTPAVCGTPRAVAHAWVRAHEPSPRGWYAGALGWFDGAGDGSFAVGLRSALVRGAEAWLFAGAGIVAGSVAENERAEVELKQRPMLDALGVEP